jgi:hypothetical protein
MRLTGQLSTGKVRVFSEIPRNFHDRLPQLQKLHNSGSSTMRSLTAHNCVAKVVYSKHN